MSESQVGEGTDSGAGNQEPDPATAENPPTDLKAGDKERDKKGAPDTEAEAGVGGSD